MTVTPRIKNIRNIITNNPNRNFAIDAAPSAIPVNPKIAAIIAITKNTADHLSIKKVLRLFLLNYGMKARGIRTGAFN